MESVFGKLEFKGFEPSAELLTSTKETLRQILGDSPSDANSIARFVKTATGFDAILKISSLAGTFMVHVSEADPFHAVHNMKDRIAQQLDRWKSNRF
jgi:hypothetical protein